MIKKYYDNIVPRYGNYFLAFEAPGDEEDPQENQGFNDIQEDDIPDDTGTQEDTPTEDAPQEDQGFNDIQEEPQEDTPTEDAPQEDQGFNDIQEEEPTEDAPVEGSNEGDSAPADNAGGDNGDENAEVDDGGFNDIEEEEPADDGGEDTTGGEDNGGGDNNEDQNKKGPGLEYESTRKYILFKEYTSLFTSINNYITKLENNIRDDTNVNRIIKTATDNLREIKELCFDYMTLKFSNSTYVQALVFYQQLVVSVELVFKLIKKIKIIDQNE